MLGIAVNLSRGFCTFNTLYVCVLLSEMRKLKSFVENSPCHRYFHRDEFFFLPETEKE